MFFAISTVNNSFAGGRDMALARQITPRGVAPLLHFYLKIILIRGICKIIFTVPAGGLHITISFLPTL